MLKKILSVVFFLIIGAFFLFSTNTTSLLAASNYGLDDTAREVSAFKEQINSQGISTGFIQTRAGQIIGFVLSFVGILFLVLMIYAGLTWMLAQGNEQRVTKAKELLTNALIGLIIVFSAYAITAFVGDFVSNQMLN